MLITTLMTLALMTGTATPSNDVRPGDRLSNGFVLHELRIAPRDFHLVQVMLPQGGEVRMRLVAKRDVKLFIRDGDGNLVNYETDGRDPSRITFQAREFQRYDIILLNPGPRPTSVGPKIENAGAAVIHR